MGTCEARARALAVIAAGGPHGAGALAIGRAVAKATRHRKQLPAERKERIGLAVASALVRRKLASPTRSNRFTLPHFAGYGRWSR